MTSSLPWPTPHISLDYRKMFAKINVDVIQIAIINQDLFIMPILQVYSHWSQSFHSSSSNHPSFPLVYLILYLHVHALTCVCIGCYWVVIGSWENTWSGHTSSWDVLCSAAVPHSCCPIPGWRHYPCGWSFNIIHPSTCQCRVVSHHITSYHLIGHRMTSLHSTSHQLISPHVTWHDMIQVHTQSCLSWFQPLVADWITRVQVQTSDWLKRAIELDKVG